MPTLGTIGNKGQAYQWIKTAQATRNWKVEYCFHPDPSHYVEYPSVRNTSDLKELAKYCNAIVIASPTKTHLFYLSVLSEIFDGIVLVEKPLVSSLAECETLLATHSRDFLSRIYVNHSFRLYPWVTTTKKTLMQSAGGMPLLADFQLAHDLAYKPIYSGTWRSDVDSHPLGPAETQGIHLIDLVHYFFGPINDIKGRVVNIAKTGTAPDTASMHLATDNGVWCGLHTSYASPVTHYMRIVTTRLVISYKDGCLVLQRRTPDYDPYTSRSKPAVSECLLNVDPESLSREAIFRQLAFMEAVLTTRGYEGGPNVYQGIANVAVLAGFAESVKSGSTYHLGDLELYKRTMAYFSTEAAV